MKCVYLGSKLLSRQVLLKMLEHCLRIINSVSSSLIKLALTHTHTRIYILRERKRERESMFNIHGTPVTANNSTNNNVLFFVSHLKTVYYNYY